MQCKIVWDEGKIGRTIPGLRCDLFQWDNKIEPHGGGFSLLDHHRAHDRCVNGYPFPSYGSRISKIPLLLIIFYHSTTALSSFFLFLVAST
jgi:hypothetical protein